MVTDVLKEVGITATTHLHIGVQILYQSLESHFQIQSDPELHTHTTRLNPGSQYGDAMQCMNTADIRATPSTHRSVYPHTADQSQRYTVTSANSLQRLLEVAQTG